MGFPCSLKTDKMALYVLENFEWYHREVAFPPLPLPSDYKDLCLDFDLAVAEGAAQDFGLPEIPWWSSLLCFLMTLSYGRAPSRLGLGATGVTFYRPAVQRQTTTSRRRRRIRSLAMHLPLLVMTARSRVNSGRDRPQGPMAEPSARKACEIAAANPWAMPLSREALLAVSNDRSRGSLDHTSKSFHREREITSFRERISAIFYIMVFPDFLSIEQAADYVRETFKWHLRRPACPPRPLPMNHHKLCLHFDLAMAKEASRDFRIPHTVWVVSYAMVVNEALKLGGAGQAPKVVPRRSAVVHLDKLDLWWAQYRGRANQGAGVGPLNSQEENLESSDAPPPSSDDEQQ
ncbi:hypothetical protein Cgig2_015784 [Carnegiea gigantea]|uniref:Uncharacterized protein n=1 Tax=Carnegiea gigantea TaxID=171969 RepID=A0A9Q1KFI6_9CARY|nr:hypothetical protein Cgig2_015784 [Carnegiea gigantea]